MTKEEFLTMIDREMTEINDQENVLNARLSEFEAKSYQSEEDEEKIRKTIAERQFLEKRRKSLESIVGFPAHVRIKNMTSEEIDAYKQEKLTDFQPRVAEIAVRENDARQYKEALEARLKESINKSATAETLEEKQKALRDMSYFQSELGNYDEKTGYIFQKIAKDREVLQGEIDTFMNRTPEEIKKSLIDKNGRSDYYEYLLTNGENVSKSMEMYAKFAEDPEKTPEIARKIATYGAYKENIGKTPVRTSLHVPATHLPEDLKNVVAIYADKVNSSDYWYDVKDEDIAGLERVVNGYEKRYKEAKEELEAELTPEKISFLIGQGYTGDDNGNKRVPTLKELSQHESKINDKHLEYEYLKDLVKSRDKLSKKFIKTSEDKRKLSYYDEQIKYCSGEVCDEIQNWYRDKFKSIAPTASGLRFESAEALQESLEYSKTEMAYTEKNMRELKNNIMTAKREMQTEKTRRGVLLSQLREDVISYAGEEYRDVDFYAPSNYDEVVNMIAEDAAVVYKKGKVTEIRETANEMLKPKESNETLLTSLTEEPLGTYPQMVQEQDEYQMPAMAPNAVVNFAGTVMPAPETIPASKFVAYEEEKVAPIAPVQAPVPVQTTVPAQTPAPATMPTLQYTDPVNTIYSSNQGGVQASAQANELETMVTETMAREPAKAETYIKKN